MAKQTKNPRATRKPAKLAQDLTADNDHFVWDPKSQHWLQQEAFRHPVVQSLIVKMLWDYVDLLKAISSQLGAIGLDGPDDDIPHPVLERLWGVLAAEGSHSDSSPGPEAESVRAFVSEVLATAKKEKWWTKAPGQNREATRRSKAA